MPKIDFPDSLTTWRAATRGVTASTAVGSATAKDDRAQEPHPAPGRPATPSSFRAMRLMISALVHNYLTTDKTRASRSTSKALIDLYSTARRRYPDPSPPRRSEEGSITASARNRSVLLRVVTGKALTDEESDAMELDLPINIPGVPLSASRGGTLANSGDVSFDLTFPDKVQPEAPAVALHHAFAFHCRIALQRALDYLTSFPYGCVEQTMSSFLPDTS